MTLQEIATVTDGELVGDPSLPVRGAAYLDSRDPEPDGLFVAVVGARTDGHDHVGTAHAVLGSRATDRPTVVVPDPVVALGKLARHLVERRRPRVFAITGSHGKTSTKEFLAAILPGATATRGNQNNELGVALTALRMPVGGGDRAGGDLVVEMGARAVGHLTYLAGITPPRFAAVTALGHSHLERFGSPELLAAAKAELPQAAEELCVLNADDPRVLAMASLTWAPVLTFGAQGDVSATDVRVHDGRASFRLGFRGDHRDVRLQVPGRHQVANACCAAALALGSGSSLDDVAAGLERLARSGEHRMERRVRHDGGILIDDCYNASPASMLAALRTLADVAPTGHRFAALGPMRELGPATARAHRMVAAAARRYGVEVLGVGPDTSGDDGVPDVETAAAVLRERLTPDDALLVKASRPSRLERLVDLLAPR